MILQSFILLFLLFPTFLSATFPVSFKGRLHPFEAYTKLWLNEFYGRPEIKKTHQNKFGLSSSQELVWRIHFEGHFPFDEAPLFHVKNAKLKEILGLNLKESYFSYLELKKAMIEEKKTNVALAEVLVSHAFQKSYKDPHNRSLAEKRELTSLSPGFWVKRMGEKIEILALPKNTLWNHFEVGNAFKLQEENLSLFSDALNVLHQLNQYEKYLPLSKEPLFTNISLQEQLQRVGSDLRALPQKNLDSPWVSLKALSLPIMNFTYFSDSLFHDLQKAYLAQDLNTLYGLLEGGYQYIEKKPHVVTQGKTLYYPSTRQLATEKYLFSFPWIVSCLLLYGGVVISCFFSRALLPFILLICAFLLHTLILILRCYVLERPPVSNMFETVIYVPWIAVVGGIVCYLLSSKKKGAYFLLITPALLSIVFLSLLELTHLDNSLENVQPVLDSQYWLTVHVLMVVGSYGFYALAALLGHIYLIDYSWKIEETERLKTLSIFILQLLYVGTALLIPGTILGGVWAAESWGRFWDWDPKESWAFISSCVYLIWIHAYRFHQIGRFGLAIGAVTGFLAISFTWYGVNYILGTGLHSYGFGSGGEGRYYAYLFGEVIFIGIILKRKFRKEGSNRKLSNN